jgi:hypothetical protein
MYLSLHLLQSSNSSSVEDPGNTLLYLEVMACHMAFGLDWRRGAETMFDGGAAWVRLMGADAAAKVLSKAWRSTLLQTIAKMRNEEEGREDKVSERPLSMFHLH